MSKDLPCELKLRKAASIVEGNESMDSYTANGNPAVMPSIQLDGPGSSRLHIFHDPQQQPGNSSLKSAPPPPPPPSPGQLPELHRKYTARPTLGRQITRGPTFYGGSIKRSSFEDDSDDDSDDDNKHSNTQDNDPGNPNIDDEFDELDELDDNGEFEEESLNCLWFRDLPTIARYLILVVFGSIVILGPAVYLILKDKTLLPNLTDIKMSELERLGQLLALAQLVRFLLWLAVAWNLFIAIWFFVGQLPYLIERLFKWIYGDCSEQVRSNLDYIPSLRFVIHFAILSVFSVASYAVLFKQMYEVYYWMAVFQVLCMLMVFSILLLAQRLSVQSIAVNFHHVAYSDRVAQLKKYIRVLDKLRKSIKGIGLTDIFDLDKIAGSTGKNADKFKHNTFEATDSQNTSPERTTDSDHQSNSSHKHNLDRFGKPEHHQFRSDSQSTQSHSHYNGSSHKSPHLNGASAGQSHIVSVSSGNQFNQMFVKEDFDEINMLPLQNLQYVEKKHNARTHHGNVSHAHLESSNEEYNQQDKIMPVSGLMSNQSDRFRLDGYMNHEPSALPAHMSSKSNGITILSPDSNHPDLQKTNYKSVAVSDPDRILPPPKTVTRLQSVFRIKDSNQPEHLKPPSKNNDTESSSDLLGTKLNRGKTIADFLHSITRSKSPTLHQRLTDGGSPSQRNVGSFDRKMLGSMPNSRFTTLTSTAKRRGRTDLPESEPSQGKLAGTSMTIGGQKNYNRSDSIGLMSDKHAIKLARKLFVALGGTLPSQAVNNPDCKTALTVDCFRPYFSSDTAAREAFDLFDADFNKSLSLKEMKQAILRVYRERRNLFGSLHDLSQALGRLNQILYGFSFLLAALFSLPIYGIPLTAVLPFTSILVALSFIFGGAAKTTFDCIVFLFVTHPYDTGDRVIIDNVGFKVIELNLLTTVFENTDGRTVYAPNSVLSQKMIHNIRRSGDQSEMIELQFSFDTPEDVLREVHARMIQFVKSESREFLPSCDMFIHDFENTNRLRCSFNIKYRGNWQDPTKRWSRRNAFMFTLKHHLKDLEVTYAMPPIPLKMIDESESVFFKNIKKNM
ncbi:hypothetical protein BATDEDRAFT_88006 [Batrachochytrium dendrobatidis JAM81]|uniref:EF-hand domain-containing protein n=1 Tax=Batrachochytrium dendrobatidis (strain JAM81 / FGSC 10211) TaxID=684364 RepID=F4P1N8_BATDJ|nr:uncharacterized protein BATDEDRAFT_88006 [Batrachochytrium dendrobatidis JAM81]EGF80674.1 hypothetical protein BATDEDRAFT_88006 [Batrachochytrium dendrobatidis JAM81]|eukprot:XP_006678655.1 hypothetical protein BATDEDRAFT_88006 [Batrachochytrium dendrobatidis JAM81]